MTTTTATRTLWAETVAPRPLLCRALLHHDPRDGVCRDCGQVTGDPSLDAGGSWHAWLMTGPSTSNETRSPLTDLGWNRRAS